MPDILCREARKDQQWRSYCIVMEAYSSMDELVDKCAYDLAHDEEWKQIAKNGYEKMPARPYLSPQYPENAEITDTYRLRYTSF